VWRKEDKERVNQQISAFMWEGVVRFERRIDDFYRLLNEEAQMLIEDLHILANDFMFRLEPSAMGAVKQISLRFFKTSRSESFPTRVLIMSLPFKILDPAKWLLWGYVVVRRKQPILQSLFLIFNVNTYIFVGVTIRMVNN